MPKVSVIIPTHNRAQYVGAAIESVLSQTLPPYEVIVIDDGSTDDTPSVLARYADRVTCLRQANAGECAARNAGLARVRNDFLAFLDDDDLFLPHHLAGQTAALEATPRAGFVFAKTIPFLDGRPRP